MILTSSSILFGAGISCAAVAFLCYFMSPGVACPSPQLLLFCVALVIVRCLLPFDFFYTITVPESVISPLIRRAVMYPVPNLNVSAGFLLLILWLTIAAVKLALLSCRTLRWSRFIRKFPNSRKMPVLRQLLKQRGIKKAIRLIEIPGCGIPFITGIKKPCIVIPPELDGEDLYYALSHELEHYKRRDLLFLTVMELLCAFYWWNPMLFVMKRRAKTLIEFRADAGLAETLNEEQRLCYLQSIINIAKAKRHDSRGPLPVLSLYSRECELEERFQRVLAHRSPKRRILPILLLSGLLFLSTAVIIEPYSFKKEDLEGTFDITRKNSYLVKIDDHTYELHVEGQGTFFLSSPKCFEFLKIYEVNER